MRILFDDWHSLSCFHERFWGTSLTCYPEVHSPIQKVMMTFATVACFLGVSKPRGWTKTCHNDGSVAEWFNDHVFLDVYEPGIV